jgi:hypothetical protein
MFWEYGYYENQKEQRLINQIEMEVMQFNRTYQRQYYIDNTEYSVFVKDRDNAELVIEIIKISKYVDVLYGYEVDEPTQELINRLRMC